MIISKSLLLSILCIINVDRNTGMYIQGGAEQKIDTIPSFKSPSFGQETVLKCVCRLGATSHKQMETYPSGSGGFGGGLLSRSIDSELWLLRTRLGTQDVCSRI